MTNDGGSIGGCTRCNKTYASKAIKYEVTRENGKEVSRRRIGETENTYARRLRESNQRLRNVPKSELLSKTTFQPYDGGSNYKLL